MRRRLIVALLAAATVVGACGGGTPATQAPTPTIAATPTATPTPTAVPTATPTPAPTPTPAIDADWVTVAPEGAGFSAKFPGEPKLQTQTQKTASGDAKVSMWTYVVSSHLVLIVAKSSYVTGALTGVSPAVLYDGAIKGMETSSGVTLQKQEDNTISGHASRNFYATSSSVSIAGMLCVVKDDLYMVYATMDSEADTDVMTAFMEDFQLTI